MIRNQYYYSVAGPQGPAGPAGTSLNTPNTTIQNRIVTWNDTTGTSLGDSTIPIYAHDDSIGIGVNSQINGSTNLKCVSIGVNTLKDGIDNIKQIAIGPFALEKMTGVGDTCIAIGHQTLTNATESSRCICLGEYCCNDRTNASNNLHWT
jgi:hypothetical protein